MKRLLLPASALVLVVTACGAGARPAPRLTQVETRRRGLLGMRLIQTYR
jgi:hypothetical protein